MGVTWQKLAGDTSRLSGLGTQEKAAVQGWERVRGYLRRRLSQEEEERLLSVESNEFVVTGSCRATLMFGTLSPQVGRDDVLALADHLLDLSDDAGETETLGALVRDVPLEGGIRRGWQQGYELAEEVVASLDLLAPTTRHIDVESLVNRLGVTVGSIRLADGRIRGVSLAGSGHRPAILVNETAETNRHPAGRRFTLAHELCHLLFDRAAGAPLAIASGPWAPRDTERRANAFAAMLLMPQDLVGRAVRSSAAPLESVVGVQRVAGTLRTSFTATLQHVTNLGLLDEWTRDQIRDEADRRET